MPPWVAKGEIGTLLLASEMPVPVSREATVSALETRWLGVRETFGVCLFYGNYSSLLAFFWKKLAVWVAGSSVCA